MTTPISSPDQYKTEFDIKCTDTFSKHPYKSIRSWIVARGSKLPRKHSHIVVHLEHLYLAHLYLFLQIFLETLNVLQLSRQLSFFSIHTSQFINTVQGL